MEHQRAVRAPSGLTDRPRHLRDRSSVDGTLDLHPAFDRKKLVFLLPAAMPASVFSHEDPPAHLACLAVGQSKIFESRVVGEHMLGVSR